MKKYNFRKTVEKIKEKFKLTNTGVREYFCPEIGTKVEINGLIWIVVYKRANPLRIALEPYSTKEYEDKIK